MNILITGASGYIASHLLQKIDPIHNNIYCQSRCYKVDHKTNWIKHDLVNDLWEDINLPHIDIVYYLAAQTSIYVAEESPINDLMINVIGLLRLLEFLKKQLKPAFVVLAGTSTQAGLVDRLPINESFPNNPITFYDVSKCSAEMYLKQYIHKGWVKGCILRLSNVFGGAFSVKGQDRGIISKVYNQALSGKDVFIYGDGKFLRDYIYIDDVVSAFLAASLNSEVTNGRAFFIGSGKSLSINDAFLNVISLAAKKTGNKVGLLHIDPPSNLSSIEFRNAEIDFSAFRDATGWSPKFNFKTGIESAYA
jgi:nucleoside-diphosphate-sugar epimerase